MDFLKVFAETGIFGFLLLLSLFASLIRTIYRAYREQPSAARSRYLAFALGALGIVLNMAIGYEMLHAFFWINIAALLYFVDRSRRVALASAPEAPPSWAAWTPAEQ